MKYKEILADMYKSYVNNMCIDEKLLSENELMLKYDTTRSVIRRALNEMVNYNLIVAYKGKGYFITPSSFIFDNNYYGSFKRSLLKERFVSSSELMENNQYTEIHFKNNKDDLIRSYYNDYYLGSFLLVKEIVMLNINIKLSLNELKEAISYSKMAFIQGDIVEGYKGISVLILDYNTYGELLDIRKLFILNNAVSIKI